jgi:hypothetical protein
MKGDQVPVRIVIERPPGGVLFRVQRGRLELLEPSEQRPESLTFDFTLRVVVDSGQPNFLGDYAQGPKAARFVYVNSGTCAGQKDTCWSRRAKIPLGGISSAMVKRVLSDADARLEVHIAGTGRDGGPVCAMVRTAERAWQVVQNN